LRDGLETIQQSGEHLLTLINDVLDLAKIEARKLDLVPSHTYLPGLLESVARIIRPRAESKGLTFHYEAPATLPSGVLTDEKRLRQVLLNLLGNAVKFTPAGGRITVGCGTSGNSVVITVADTGPGIPTEYQAAIFEPFMQVGRSLTSGHEGTGLGLAISRDLARAMGAELTVRSTPGKGSTFMLALPPA
jgi:signal transduction histidine kinase